MQTASSACEVPPEYDLLCSSATSQLTVDPVPSEVDNLLARVPTPEQYLLAWHYNNAVESNNQAKSGSNCQNAIYCGAMGKFLWSDA
jgi:hypothetical protein